MKYTLSFYKDKKKEWRWKIKHRNGNLIADSGEGYKRKSGARKAIKNLLDWYDSKGRVEQLDFFNMPAQSG